MKGKNPDASKQALEVNKYYHTLTMEEKRLMIQEFFRQGGRKQGLSMTFSQVVHNSQKADDKSWSGYINVAGLMKKWEVIA